MNELYMNMNNEYELFTTNTVKIYFKVAKKT